MTTLTTTNVSQKDICFAWISTFLKVSSQVVVKSVARKFIDVVNNSPSPYHGMQKFLSSLTRKHTVTLFSVERLRALGIRWRC